MAIKNLIIVITILLTTGCNTTDKNKTGDTNDCERLKIKEEITAAIKQTTDCNKRKDIDCFMAIFDSLFILESNETADKNRTLVKDTVKKDILRDWGIIATMYEVERWIDNIEVPSPDTAIVFTNQFYHRTFTKPNNLPGIDDVVTTQRHRETWIKRSSGWKQQRVKELGGAIYVNGKLYTGQ